MESPQEEAPKRTLASLSSEILLLITDQLDSTSLRALRRTSRFFRQLISLETIFRRESAEMESGFTDEWREQGNDGQQSLSTEIRHQQETVGLFCKQFRQTNEAHHWYTEKLKCDVSALEASISERERNLRNLAEVFRMARLRKDEWPDQVALHASFSEHDGNMRDPAEVVDVAGFKGGRGARSS